MSAPCRAVSTGGDSVFAHGWSEVYICGRNPGMGTYLPGIRWLYARFPVNQRSAIGVGVSPPCGVILILDTPFPSPGRRSCRRIEVFLIWGYDPMFPGSGETSTFARGGSLAARWFHEPQLISNQQAGLEFPYRVGRYRPGESPFSSPGSSIRGWDLILPGFGRTSTLSLGATLASHRVHEPQSISIQLVVLGFPHRVG